MIKRLTEDQHSALMRSKRSLQQAFDYAVEAQRILHDYFAEPRARDLLAVSFVPNEKGLGAEVLTPFGRGRAVAVNALADDGAHIRYIFEKFVDDVSGASEYVKLAEIRIHASGLVTSEDGTKLAELNSLYDSENSHAVIAVGLSVIFAFGTSTQYSAVAE